MPNIKERPYGLLLFTAIAISLAFVFPPIANIDFQEITMFSIPLAIMAWIIPMLLLSLWLLYLLTRRFLYSMTITWIHVLITVLATILIVTILYIGLNPSQLKNNRYELIGNAIQILFVILVFGQLTYLANVLLGLFTKRQMNRR